MIAGSTAVRRGFALALVGVLATSGCAAGRLAQTANQVPTQYGTNATVGTMALRGISLAAPPNGRTSYRSGSAVQLHLVLVNTGTRDEKLTNIVTSAARGWAAYPTRAEAAQVVAAQNSRQLPGSSGPSASTTPGTTPSATGSTTGSGTPSGTPTSGTSTSSTSTSSTPAAASSTSGSSSAAASPTATVPVGQTSVTIPSGRRVSFGVPDSTRVLLLRSSVGTIQPGSTVKITFTFSRSGSVTVAVPVRLSYDPDFPTVSGGSTGDEGN